MTAAQEETWIEGSLARLETLETQRQQLAATGQTAALAEVDEEIRALYEVLESAAGEDQQPANTGMPAAPMGMAVAPMGMAPPMQQQPMQPMQPMQAPMGMGMGAPSMPMDPMAVSSGFALDDDKPSRSPLPFIIGGVVVLVLGIGGFVMMSGNDKDAKPAPTEAAKEIKAGAISEDTQEPVVAKGADADRTSGTKYKEPAAVDRDVRRPASSGVSRPRPTKKEEDDGRKITVEKTRDPLAGID